MARITSNLCRSFMYVPGDKMKMIDKIINAASSEAPDIAVFDCEDGVGYENKSKARDNIFISIKDGKMQKCQHSNVCIRVNSNLTGSLVEDDLKFVAECLKSSDYAFPQMVNLPKVETVDQAIWLDDKIRHAIDYKRLHQSIKLSLMIESCKAVVKLPEILSHLKKNMFACFEMSNIVFGSDDYCATLGVSRSTNNTETLFARQMVANTARAFNISAIDMVDIDLTDSDYLEKNCSFGAQLGFLGKQVIHPKQLQLVHKCFSPNPKQVEWAEQLLGQFNEYKGRGEGVFVFRGQMIDQPTVTQAENIVAQHNNIRSK